MERAAVSGVTVLFIAPISSPSRRRGLNIGEPFRARSRALFQARPLRFDSSSAKCKGPSRSFAISANCNGDYYLTSMMYACSRLALMIIQPDYMTVRPNPTAVTMDWAINEYSLQHSKADAQMSGSGHKRTFREFRRCPLYPRNRTWFSTILMFALCQYSEALARITGR